MEASDSWKTVMGYYIHDLDNDLSFLTTEKNWKSLGFEWAVKI